MVDPTPQERRLLNAIRDNPFLSQQSLATHLRISRSTVASHIRSLQAKGYIEGRAYILNTPEDAVLCIGGINTDVTFRLSAPFIPGTSNIGVATETPGGVARNVAEAIATTGTRAILAGPIGSDNRGHAVVKTTSRAGVDCSAVATQNGAFTGTYTAVIDPTGGLVAGLSDMGILDDITWNDIRPRTSLMNRVSWMFIDANLPPAVAESALVAGQRAGIPIAADAVSVQKASRIAALRFDLVFCNVEEASVLLGGKPVPPDESAVELVGLGHKAAVVTHGSNGASWANAHESNRCRAIDTVHGDVTGAGDSLIAGTLAGLCNGETLARAVALGTRLAAQALNRVGASHSAPEIAASEHLDAITERERI